MVEQPNERRPTYWGIVLGYLQEGYRAWQARESASAATVEAELGLSLVPEGLDYRRELEELGLIALSDTRDDPHGYRLLPRGVAFMDGSPRLDVLLNAPAQTLEATAPSSASAVEAKRGWLSIVVEWGIKQGLDSAWENRLALWAQLRAQFPWLPELPL